MALLKEASEMFNETGCVPGIDGEQVPAEKIVPDVKEYISETIDDPLRSRRIISPVMPLEPTPMSASGAWAALRDHAHTLQQNLSRRTLRQRG
jgi:hypothetical protein